MTKKEAIRRLTAISKMLSNAKDKVNRKRSMRESEKVMTLMAYGDDITAVGMGIEALELWDNPSPSDVDRLQAKLP